MKAKTPRTKITFLKPLVTEKAVMLIEAQNTLVFEASKIVNKTDLKKKVEDLFNVKVDKVRAHVKNNKKYFYVKLNPKNLAIDLATKLGLM